MKITKNYLKQVIKEELDKMEEGTGPGMGSIVTIHFRRSMLDPSAVRATDVMVGGQSVEFDDVQDELMSIYHKLVH